MRKILIIYHRVDYDGVFSACITQEFFKQDTNNDIKLLGWNYNDSMDQVNQSVLEAETVVMVDISFPADFMLYLKGLNDSGNKEVYWIDHHITAIDDSKKFGYDDLPGLRDISNAACELCWFYYFHNINSPKLVQYVGAYDIWNKSKFDWEEETYPVQLGLKVNYGVNEKGISVIWKSILNNDEETVKSIIHDGKLIYKFQQRIWKSNCKNYAFPVTVAGKYKGVAMINTEFGSNQFKSILDDYDVYIVVNRRGPDCFNISMYKEPDRITEFSLGGYTTKLGNTMAGHLCAAGSQLTLKQFEQFIETCEI